MTAAIGADASRSRHGRWFYVGTALFMIALSAVGFGPSIIDQTRRIAPATVLTIAHGVAAAGWLLLFLTQTILIARRRVAAHRRLGVVGPALALLMVVITVYAAIESGRRGHDASGDGARVFSTPAGIALPTRATAESVVPLLGNGGCALSARGSPSWLFFPPVRFTTNCHALCGGRTLAPLA